MVKVPCYISLSSVECEIWPGTKMNEKTEPEAQTKKSTSIKFQLQRTTKVKTKATTSVAATADAV